MTHSSLAFDPEFSTESPQTVRALFYGLGSDGTVGANKNSITIIGEKTPSYAQGYFVYDSKKSGSITVSHLRFGPDPIRSTYLISKASFVGCHQFAFLERMDMLAAADQGATFLLNAPYAAGRGVGPSAAQRAAADYRQAASLLRDRRVQGGARCGHGRPHQHDHADVLFRGERRPAARRSDRRDQIRDRGDLRQARRSDRAKQLRRGGHDAGESARSYRPRKGEQHYRYSRAGALARAGVRPRRARHSDRGPRRLAAYQRPAARRHLSDRHGQMGEAQHRAGNPGLG